MDNEQAYNTSGTTMDDIVFQHRNKEYGAYDLRTAYRRLLTRSFVLGTVTFMAAVGAPFLYLKIQEMNAADEVEVKADMVDIIQEDKIIEKPEEKEPEPEPEPPKVEEKIEVIKNIVPEPKREPKNEEPPPKQEEIATKNTGTQAQEGVEAPKTNQPPVQQPPVQNPGTGNKPPEPPKPDDRIREGNVDVEASFPGGLPAFRQKVFNSFSTDDFADEGGSIKAEVVFVVEKDGSITDIKANGPNRAFNEEAIRTVKAIKQKWSPAKDKGLPVRSRFRLPITMNFEG